MTTSDAGSTHDLWVTLAQVISVIGFALGVLISRFARAKIERPVGRGDHLYRTIMYAVLCLILAIGWVLSLVSIYAPISWLDADPGPLVIIVGLVGAALLTVPVFEYAATLPPKRHGEHVEGDASAPTED